ncbi:MAG TPA: glutamate-1-semialdehyde 2,1-aminomutase [Desulfohalobiaceae bacterium]|nr:glutamate-1-semialdehyde 2,1-aminomutase [Desulfohalobiaceae bacterium]
MTNSEELFSRAQRLIPGGVNSPVRACQSVDTFPLFISQGKGSHLISEDGQEFIDYVMSWGPLILGHCPEQVIKAAQGSIDKGSSFGAPIVWEIELAEKIIQAVPSIEMIRMVNSGTEATMSAVRLARAFTGQNKIVKFTGCYHGHVDSLLAQAGSGVATLSLPGTPGVPEDLVKHTLLAPYNDQQAIQDLFKEHGQDIAAVIVEPVAGNMGLVLPQEGFLQFLRSLTKEYSSLLIFDEVISGFRISYGGAQEYFNVIPDLTCLGKIIGGGFPVGALGGKKKIMEQIAPSGSMYQAGTLAGNPVAMAAGLTTLKILENKDYNSLELSTRSMVSELSNILNKKGLPVQCNTLGSLATLFFTPEPVVDFASAQKTDTNLFKKWYLQMREQGIYLAPSNFECIFTSFAHTEKDYEQTLEAARRISL